MNRSLLFILWLACNCIASSQNIDQINFTWLGDKVLIVRSGKVYPDQVVAVKSEKGILIFDTGISPTLTKEYRKIIEQEFLGSKIAYVLNTHQHFDHTNGNQIFADEVIIAHDNCVAAMKEAADNFNEFINYRRDRYTRRDKLAETLDPSTRLYKKLKDLVFMSKHMCDDMESIFRQTLPNITFTDQVEIDLGDMKLELFHFTPGIHTDNDVIAVIPELGYVFTGDLLYEIESVALITSKHNLKNAVDVLDNVIESCGNIKNIITIHGGMMPASRLINYRKLLYDMLCEKNANESAVVKIEAAVLKYGIEKSLLIIDEITANPNYYFWEGDLIELANKFVSGDKPETGIALFELCAKLFPESVNAFEWLGEAYYQTGNYTKAESAFNRALELDPVDSFAADMIYLINNY